ncbi:MAG: BamA/TamA family outer membrane protein [Gemmatimonadota bacterium]
MVLSMAVTAAGCGAYTRAAELYPEVAEHAGKRIEDVSFEGNDIYSRDTLLTVVQTQPTRCSLLGLPICVPFTGIGRQVHHLDATTVAEDVTRLRSFYRREGYFGTRIDPETQDEGEETVDVLFRIRRGHAVTLDSLTVEGTEGVLDPDSLARTLPLVPGERFRLGDLVAAADIILSGLQRRGHANAEVLRNFAVDTVRDRASASLLAVPGPRVVIDSIIVTGAEHLGRGATLRQLPFAPGDVLRRTQLAAGQRNLYDLNLVQFASVTQAPDSLQAVPEDSTRATVLVAVAERSVHQVDAAVGYGSVECVRTEADWVSRSFGGGARRLELGASASRIGIAAPLDAGLGRFCGGAPGDTVFGQGLDYRVSADLDQPYFLSPLNQLSVGLFAERLSEPSVFRRRAVGGHTAVTRRIGREATATAGLDVERGSTVASAALFCAAFQVCQPALVDTLSQERFRNSLGVSAFWNHADDPLNPTSGFTLSSGVTWAAPWLLSDISFFRFSANGSLYRTLRPGWVGSVALRVGNFFRTANLTPGQNFLPPEERFYAGGANSVRGFERNALGPGVYVTSALEIDTAAGTVRPVGSPTFVPVGGTAVGVLNAEVRFPSPFLGRMLRLAAFVDAGVVSSGNLWDLGSDPWKLTPGAGIRLATPVGPLRLDVAYNPHGPAAGPLYLSNPDKGSLVRVDDSFRGAAGSFFQRLRIHVAVGQAF